MNTSTNPLAPLVREIVRATIAELLPHLAAKSETWIALPTKGTLPEYALTCRAVRDAGRRGELEIRAGRPPAVRRDELERWIASRRAPALTPGAADAADYEAIAGGAR